MMAGLTKHTNGTALWTEEARTMGKTMHSLMKELNRKGPQESVSGYLARLVGNHWITTQRSLTSPLGWELYSETWPRAGTMRSGIVCQQAPLVPLTKGIESGLWPTPVSQEGGEGSDPSL